MCFPLFLGSTSDTKALSASTTPPGANTQQKKSILVGKRPGLGVSSMLSQFKNYTQAKKSPVFSQRPSVFCSPEDEDEEEDADYSRFLEMKGNSRPLFVSVSLQNSMAWTFQCIFCRLQWHSCLVRHFIYGALRVIVLIPCLKSLPQRTQTPDLLSIRWPLLWRREDLTWRQKPRRITRTILFSRKFKGQCSTSGFI